MMPISYKAWVNQPSRAVLLLVHGLGANVDWWEAAGNYFLKNNLSSYAIDLRSYGSFEEFFSAIREFHGTIRKENLSKKIFVIGESMGALIILSMALKDQSLFDGLVCIAPALNSKTPLKAFDYVKIFLPLLYNSKKVYKLPVTPDMCTRDLDFLKIIESTYDKDVSSTSKVLFDIFISQLFMRSSRMKIDSPLLFLVAGNDLLVYSRDSKKVFNKIRAKDKTLIEYPGMYHSMSTDIDKEKVFHDIVKWVEGRV